MNNFLGKQFSRCLTSEDFNAAIEIIKQARSRNYPNALINFWENSLEKLEPGIRHPLDSALEPSKDNHSLSFELASNLRENLLTNLTEYFKENNISMSLFDEIVDLIFKNIDLNNGTILIPDLTSKKPATTLLHYSAYQYSIENPDVSEAVRKGLVPSEMDHFLRCGYIEILNGRRYSSLCLSHERKKFTGKLLYIVDDYEQLNESEKSFLKAPQLDRFMGDILSIKHNTVFTSTDSPLDIETYLFLNISEYHNICILMANKTLTHSATKWIIDIKLDDREAIFGYSASSGRFCSAAEYSYSNMLTSDITNGCAIVNSIEALAVVNNLREYKSAYGFYHALILQMQESGVKFRTKNEILSKSNYSECVKVSSIDNNCWSPFFWSTSSNSNNTSLLNSIRTDFITTWRKRLPFENQDNDFVNSEGNLWIDTEKLVVKLKPRANDTVAVVIPFKDKIHLLKNCVDSLMIKKEEIGFKVYAINNNSCEPSTFKGLNMLKDKYQERFICIDSPGEFNYSKINNEAVDMADEDYILFLNNDILIDSNFTITTLLKTHHFYNAIITGSKLLYPSGRIQHNGLAITQEKHVAVHSPFRGQNTNLNHELLSDGDSHPWNRTHECSAVTAACMLMKKEDFLSIGGFNEELKVAYNDVDLCFRAKEKYTLRPIICATDTKIFHLESESRGLDDDDEKAARLYHERIKLINRHENLFTHPDEFTGVNHPFDDIQKYIKTNFDRKFIDISCIPKSDIDLEELTYYQSNYSKPRKYACIFVHYDKDSLISADCVHHIEKLSDYCDLFFVSSSEYLEKSPEEIEKIKPFCKQILIRKNSGYDFGCWSHVIRKNYSQLCEYEGVLLANDSNWGPLKDFSDTFSKINNLLAEVDFIGLTSSTTPSWHLQSFFIIYSKKVFESAYFKQHWFNIGIHNSKIDIIMSYEVDWCTRLKRLGFIGTSLYGDSSTANNPTHVDWKMLIKNHYPYLKKELIRENPLRIDLSELPIILSSYEWNWKDCLLDYLKRYGNEKSDIAELLQPHESFFEQSVATK